MTTARLDLRLNQEVKSKAEKASILLGLKSLTEYVVKLMDEDASKVIKKHESLTLQNNIFDEFILACENSQQPNTYLLDAYKLTKESGIK